LGFLHFWLGVNPFPFFFLGPFAGRFVLSSLPGFHHVELEFEGIVSGNQLNGGRLNVQ
jgi:hypothetical protein